MMSIFKRGRRAGSQLGVFVTPEGVAVAQVKRGARGEKPRLERCAYERIADAGALASVVGKLSGRGGPAVSVLDPAGYRLLLVEAPDVPEEELRAAVRWRVKDLIDFHIDDAVIDVFEMPRHARGGANRMMYAVTAKADVVKQQIEVAESAGLDLGVIDIPELALRNLATLLEADERGTAFLYLADRRSTLLLVRQGVLYLTRHVETGARTLADAGELRRDLIAGLALEIRRSLDYFESHYEQTSIPQLYTSGLDAADREALANDLGAAVRELDFASLFDTVQAVPTETQRLCLPAVGAALRHDPVAL